MILIVVYCKFYFAFIHGFLVKQVFAFSRYERTPPNFVFAGARKREFLDCKLAAPVRFFRGFEPRFRVHLLRHACSFFVASYVVFKVLRFSLSRFFTLIAFDKKENAVPMQTA